MLKTERLIIRNFANDDWEVLQQIVLQHQASEHAKFEPEWPSSDEEVRQICAWFGAGNNYLAVCLQADGSLIGMLAIEPRTDQTRHVRNLGYLFHPQHQGKGYASEACRAILQHIFETLGADSVLSGTHPDNQYSVRLLNKLGFVQVKPGEFALSATQWQTHTDHQTSAKE